MTVNNALKYGPQTAEVEALIERARALTNAEARARGASRAARRVRILRYFEGGRFEVLTADDSRRTVTKEQLVFTKGKKA